MTVRHPYKYMSNQNINDLLNCYICSHPFVNPVKRNDGNSGCQSCMAENMPNGLTSYAPITEPIILEMVNSLLVLCEGCGEENIRRDQLAIHEMSNCRRAHVFCKAKDLKCSWRGVREELDYHLERCVFEPLRPALAEIFAENQRLKDRISILESRIQLTPEMNNLSII